MLAAALCASVWIQCWSSSVCVLLLYQSNAAAAAHVYADLSGLDELALLRDLLFVLQGETLKVLDAFQHLLAFAATPGGLSSLLSSPLSLLLLLMLFQTAAAAAAVALRSCLGLLGCNCCRCPAASAFVPLSCLSFLCAYLLPVLHVSHCVSVC